MNTAKKLMIAIGVCAIVGDTLALKASKRNAVAFCADSQFGQTTAIPNATIAPSGIPNTWCEVPGQAGLVHTSTIFQQ